MINEFFEALKIVAVLLLVVMAMGLLLGAIQWAVDLLKRLFNNKPKIFLGIIIICIFVVLVLIPSEVVVGEKPCVDGYRNKNLEGIMCEDTEFSLFGLNEAYSFLIVFLGLVIGGTIMFIGINIDYNENRKHLGYDS